MTEEEPAMTEEEPVITEKGARNDEQREIFATFYDLERREICHQSIGCAQALVNSH